MLRVHVTEFAPGYWRAYFDGEESAAILDRSPDQALAGLVRANLRRLGLAELSYRSLADAESEGPDREVPASQGATIVRPANSHPGQGVEGG